MPSTNQYGGLVTAGLRDNHRCHGLGIFEKAVVDSNNGRAGMPLVSPGHFTPKVTTEIQTFLSKSPRRCTQPHWDSQRLYDAMRRTHGGCPSFTKLGAAGTRNLGYAPISMLKLVG